MNEQTLERHPENAVGPWMITDECIACELCGEIAPTIFRSAEDHSQYIVYHQPGTPEEEALALEAAEQCPVEAIIRTRVASSALE